MSAAAGTDPSAARAPTSRCQRRTFPPDRARPSELLALLHLLAVLARIKSFTFPMPRPRPNLDRALTATAGAALAALALSHAPGLHPLGDPAAALAVAVAGVLALRVLTIALRTISARPA